MDTPAVVRDKQINIRLSEEESTRLGFLTDHYGINTAALIRMLLKREEERVRREIKKADE